MNALSWLSTAVEDEQAQQGEDAQAEQAQKAADDAGRRRRV